MSDSSDTNVSSPVVHKGKRKAVVLSDSNRESDSSSAPDLDVSLVKRSVKRKARIRESESDSDNSIEKQRKIKRVPRLSSDSDDSSSDESEQIGRKKASRVVRCDDSNESDSSYDLSDVGFEDNTSSENDEWESDWVSESEINPATEPIKSSNINTNLVGNISDSSDGESEKCPICLLSFNQQEVGTPETCDHSFCAECIQEWSKNVNTCPVDRQTFTLVLVRKRYNGKVIRRVPVDVRRPSEDELIQEDPTYCEVCGMSDREDRLLLCDGCDLGYHLECLDPPMDTVPVEEWFCSLCSGRTSQENREQRINARRSNHPRNEHRLLPRTSQSERIRATIETNRIHYSAHHDQQSISSGFEDVSMPGTSASASHSGSNSTTRRRTGTGTGTGTRKKRKTTRRRKRKVQYSISYEICETTGEKVAIKTRKKTRRKATRRKKKSRRRTIKPKTVKKRLAFQLGMCPLKSVGLAVPEVKVKPSTTGNIGYQRTQAGIPTLHLFGQRDQLDYFSGSDEEMPSIGSNSGSARILSQSRGHIGSSMGALRRAARRKAALLSPVPPAASVNSCDILGSILDSQAKLHSKHSKLSVTRDGTVHIENDRITTKTNNNNNKDIIKQDNDILINNNPPPLDLTSRNNTDLETTQAPMFPGRGGGNRQPYGFNRGGYRANENRYDNHQGGNYNNFQSGGNRGRGGGGNYGFGNNQRDNFSGGNYMNFHHHGGPPPFRGRGSPRFPIRRPQYAQHQNEAQHPYQGEVESEPVEPVDLVLDDPNDQIDASRVQEQEDVDIYSDIEDNVQTQEEEEDEMQVKPPPPPPPPVEGPAMLGLVSQAYNNSDDDDSDSELIIDDTKDDKNDAIQAGADTDSNSESAMNLTAQAVVAPAPPVESIPVVEKTEELNENRQMQPFSQQVVKQVVQEVLQEHLNTPSKKCNREYDEDDEISDDDCPNFSIYSTTSMDIAKSTDFSVDIPNENAHKPEQSAELDSEKIPTEETATLEEEDKPKDDWPSGDEWDTCDAENAQKSWDQPSEPPTTKINTPEDNSDKSDQNEEPIKETETETETIELFEENNEQNNKNDENDSDSDELIETDVCRDEGKRSPSPETIVNPEKTNENIISESLTPPLPPSSIPMPCEQPVVDKTTTTPIRIAFNPNVRKILKAPPLQTTEKEKEKEKVIQLYDDSDYEEWELKNDEPPSKPYEETSTSNNANELEKLTEAISEEERSYTPCLDEKDPTKLQYSEEESKIGAGIGGMDTEMISDDERNEFDESHDMKTISDGDALEINAKESELELARPEDYEEGEIVEKAAAKQAENKQEVQPDKSVNTKANVSEDEKKKRPKKKPEKEVEKEKQTENEKGGKKSEFKKISKNTKERNYRDKERSKSKEHAKGKENRETNSKEELRKKKERKRDLERYNVRNIVADKPKKDQFGRDIKSASRSSRSVTPRRSRSPSWNRAKKRRRRSRSTRRSRSRSHTPRSRSRGRSPRRSRSFRRSKSPRRSRSRSFRRSRTPKNKRHREMKSLSRDRDRVRYRNRSRRSADRTQRKKKNNRSTSRNRMRTRSPSPSKHRLRNEWTRQGDTVRHHSYTREWTPSWSRSPTPPRPIPRHNLPQSMSPSWTPPIAIDKGPVQPENLTVILNNDVNKTKKKEKRKKADKKSRDEYRKRKRADRTPPPSKEVFASGDNILVSVSFNKTNEENTVQREVMGVKRKRDSVSDSSKKKKDKNGEKKKKRAKSPRTKKKNKEIANLKPVAIIDLDRSPFKELTPSPKDIIVLSDSDNCEKEDEAMMVHHHEMLQEELMALGAQIQEDSAPQSPNNYLNTTGPKTPPEPQIKFLLTSKQSQLRAINNPLHDPNDEVDQEIDPQEELEHRLDDILHKGPNTPPEPPSSPPSSPDAYDPFDPTKSRSPTPEPAQNQPPLSTPGDTKESESDLVDLAVGPLESSQKSACALNESTEKQTQAKSVSPERPQTRTPPIISSEQTTESIENKNDSIEKSPERNPIGVIINQQVQLPAVVKPIIPTSSSVITSTAVISNTSMPPRTNLFSTSTAVGGTPRIATSVPQRIILPTPSKSSPAKMSPLKTSPSKPPIKSTPIKPMPSKTMISKLPVPNMKPLTPIRKGVPAKPVNRNVGQNGNEVIDVDLDFDSPYSPGSSDYEDLFEPPAETVKANTRQKNSKSPAKQNAFDNLFGSSPVFRNNKQQGKSKTNAPKIPVKMNKNAANPKCNSKTVGVKIDEDNLKILDDLPNSAVEMQVKDKFLKKLNRQERVVEEVKLVLKPHYNKKHVTKEQYKDILRRAVPKICHNRSGEINPKKIQNLIEAYVKKARHGRKTTTNPSNQGSANQTVAQQPKPTKATFWS